jgi:SsrA-binding protein
MSLVVNKKARHEYTIERTYTAGIVLSGQEVKSLRLGHGSFAGSYVRIISGEAFLLNAQINAYKFAITTDYDPKRTRKLLLNKKELLELQEWSHNKGRSIVPLTFFAGGRNIKVDLGVGRGKKEFEKRAVLKQRDQEREIARDSKYRIT